MFTDSLSSRYYVIFKIPCRTANSINSALQVFLLVELLQTTIRMATIIYMMLLVGLLQLSFTFCPSYCNTWFRLYWSIIYKKEKHTCICKFRCRNFICNNSSYLILDINFVRILISIVIIFRIPREVSWTLWLTVYTFR